MWGLVQSSTIGELCQNWSGLLALASDPRYFGWVSREHSIQISDRRLLLPLSRAEPGSNGPGLSGPWVWGPTQHITRRAICSVVAPNNNILKQLVSEAKHEYEKDAEHRIHIFLGDT
jgi:hypothetical protein